jgi:hypothetical protein
MKQVWKYHLTPDSLTKEIPAGGIIRHVDEQFEQICVWVEVDPDQPQENRFFEVYGTGHDIPEDMDAERIYLGSVKLHKGTLVFHIYEYVRI